MTLAHITPSVAFYFKGLGRRGRAGGLGGASSWTGTPARPLQRKEAIQMAATVPSITVIKGLLAWLGTALHEILLP